MHFVSSFIIGMHLVRIHVGTGNLGWRFSWLFC